MHYEAANIGISEEIMNEKYIKPELVQLNARVNPPIKRIHKDACKLLRFKMEDIGQAAYLYFMGYGDDFVEAQRKRYLAAVKKVTGGKRPDLFESPVAPLELQCY